MFRKLKDKIAEEVKSSPQRLQQFAQAAQAAVTSASSSISDISNNDLFTIADDDTPQNSPYRNTNNLTPGGFQDVSLSHTPSPLHSNSSNDKQETGDTLAPLISNHYNNTKGAVDNFDNGGSAPNLGMYPPLPGGTRTRRLSNSSTASDVSFRLPSYESPGGMFHLQSDLDISASEMEDNVTVPAQLERVSKEHLYAAYRRTNEKYNKYRGRYTDLARHYKSLERENAKARAVLVETQDKALRRISELREQCQLEQSAKAHLENALRLELDERNLKIESLNTKIKLLQSYSSSVSDPSGNSTIEDPIKIEEKSDSKKTVVADLINIDDNRSTTDTNNIEECPKDNFTEIQNKHASEIQNLNNKIQKLEQLLIKCKDTIKTHKEKNSQLTTEIQIVSGQLEKKCSENEQLGNKIIELTDITSQLDEAKEQIKKLQSELDSFESIKQNDISVLKNELTTAKEEISNLNGNIDMLNHREEENVISLAENKLSIHKELESKENEIKSLNKTLSKLNSDVKASEIVITDLKHKLKDLEDDKSRFKEQLVNFDETKDHISNLEGKLKELRLKNQEFETKYAGLVENFKCTELQLKQEADEKLAIIDRNNFLESRNKQLSDENASKNRLISDLEKDVIDIKKTASDHGGLITEHESLTNEHCKLKSDFDQVLTSKESLENEVNKINDALKNASDTIEKLTTQNIELQRNLQTLDAEMKNIQASRDELNTVNLSVKNELDQLKLKYDTEIKEFKNKVNHLENELSAKLSNSDSNEEANLKKKVEDLQNLLKTSTLEIENKLTEYNTLREELKDLHDRHETKIAECNEINKELNDVKINFAKISDEKIISDEHAQAIDVKLNSLQSEFDQLIVIKEKLEKKLSAAEEENENVKSKINKMLDDINLLQNELTLVRDSHTQILSEKENIEKKILKMEQYNNDKVHENDTILQEKLVENEALNLSVAKLKTEVDKLTNEKEELTKNLNEMKENVNETDSKLKEYSENNQVWQLKLSNILDDNNTLQEKCGKFKQEKEIVLEKVSVLEQKLNEFDSVKAQFEEAKLEKEFLNMRINQLDTHLKQINSEKNQLLSDHESIKTELSKVTNDRQYKIQTLNENITKLKNDLQNSEKEQANVKLMLEEQNKEKEKLSITLQSFTDKTSELQKLQEEKISLDAKNQEIVTKLTALETSSAEEIDALRSELQSIQNKNELLESKSNELNELTKKYDDLKIDSDRLNVKIRVLEQVESEHLETIEKMHSLKDENNKMLSDIEGLQNQLTKVSKDNSELNDKIRELLASEELIQAKYQKGSESSVPRDEQTRSNSPPDQAALELQLNKLTDMNTQLLEQLRASEDLSNRILDLERQNSILVEEKLELEDQVKSSMDRDEQISNVNESNVNSELKKLRNNNEDIIRDKMELESQLANLELINRSNDSNTRILEQKNEKLKLSNEKLERRLDEALVSLSHIRTMEENTELEYLRNILYEYLTGPTNNNMVLAKVLAAVVKFDHRQTQLVLEREKERQGVLGQLGLL
ncbi:golgin subfamily A member Golgin-245 [Arctopsyche grandis]|uniref:golgin subfamily A member Golgin-245 n=1 Tax=Arctopsyche grandis TaxID=121162 RepID=UPI00406DA2C1